MSFYNHRLSDNVSHKAKSYPRGSVSKGYNSGGFRQANINWTEHLSKFAISYDVCEEDVVSELVSFFLNTSFGALPFRFKDWTDFSAGAGEGVFQEITPTTFQMYRRYPNNSNNYDRKITRPVVDKTSVIGGVGAVVDPDTGIVTVSSGTPKTWAGEYDKAVEFVDAELTVEIIEFALYGMAGIELMEVRE